MTWASVDYGQGFKLFARGEYLGSRKQNTAKGFSVLYIYYILKMTWSSMEKMWKNLCHSLFKATI